MLRLDIINTIKNNILKFILIPLISAIILTTIYSLFQDRIKYLDPSSEIVSIYEVSDELTNNIDNEYYISFNDIILDAENLLLAYLSIDNKVDHLDKYINYNALAQTFFVEDALRILKNDKYFNQYYSYTDPVKIDDEKITLTLKYTYNHEKHGDLDEYVDELNKKFKDNASLVQKKYNRLIQLYVLRYIEQIEFILADQKDVMETYHAHLEQIGAQIFFDNVKNFSFKEDFNSLSFRKEQDVKEIFIKPSPYFVFFISYIIGIVLTFIFTNNKKNIIEDS